MIGRRLDLEHRCLRLGAPGEGFGSELMKRLWSVLTNGWGGLISSLVVGSIIVWLILDEHGRNFAATTAKRSWSSITVALGSARCLLASTWDATVTVQHPIIWTALLLGLGCVAGMALPWRIRRSSPVQLSGLPPEMPPPRMLIDASTGALVLPETPQLNDDDRAILKYIAK